MPNSFAPPGETPNDLWIERANLDGFLLSGVAYGVLFTLTFQVLLLFFKPVWRKISWLMVTYTFLMFTLATIAFGGNAKYNEMTFIDDRNIPGGPNAFTEQFYTDRINMMVIGCYQSISLVADALVLWRFSLIWNYSYWMCILPCLMYLGSVSMSIALLVAMTRPGAGSGFWSQPANKFAMTYYSLSISLNIILTLLISGRLLFIRNRVTRILGVQHAKMYTSVVAMLIESAALYSIWGLAFLICYARNTPFQNILLPPLGQVQGISPVLILLRVAQGRAWSKETVGTTNTKLEWKTSTGVPVTIQNATLESVSLGDATAYSVSSSLGGVKISVTAESISKWEEGKSTSC